MKLTVITIITKNMKKVLKQYKYILKYIYKAMQTMRTGKTRRRSMILSPITHIDFCVKFKQEVYFWVNL